MEASVFRNYEALVKARRERPDDFYYVNGCLYDRGLRVIVPVTEEERKSV